MPFGLCNAPATFQRLMETFLRGLVGSDCLVYLDDVIVFGKTVEEHTARLREVFRRLREVVLKV
ncbi:Retrovirus-related Pol polyprotein from transposon 17.6 [Trichinella sp. T6]|nr:Retrovirus-related Pol polyprotein from transposon 17.6 [Trichinella sp. T6]